MPGGEKGLLQYERDSIALTNSDKNEKAKKSLRESMQFPPNKDIWGQIGDKFVKFCLKCGLIRGRHFLNLVPVVIN